MSRRRTCDRLSDPVSHTMWFFLIFVIFLFTFSLIARAEVPSEDSVLMAVREVWPHLPSESEITEAYDSFVASSRSNVEILSGPLKKHIPGESDPLIANCVFLKLTVTLDSSTNKTIPQAMSLKYDFENSRFYFTGVMMPGIKRNPQDTAALLYNEDLDWLNDGWMDESAVPADTSAPPRQTEEQIPSSTRTDDWDDDWDNEDDEIPTEVVVGGAAAVVVIAAAMANAKKAKRKKGRPANPQKQPGTADYSKASEPEGPAGYILQLTQDHIALSEGMDATVGIRALKVDAKGQTSFASDAEIRLQPQTDTRLLLSPNIGMGALNVKITQNGAAQQEVQETVLITATIAGKMIQTTLAVNLTGGWKMVFF